MTSSKQDQNERGIAHFAALKTAIANGEEETVKELLPTGPMQDLEKDYLIELAELNNNRTLINLLQNIPSKD
jgi:hypothetical protein